ncbi:MAG: hypothetical protein HC929_04095 [Leptolyngbyaceae cyanobacterium SM2_5_2]|nr:hypothetical protein [Leptolyngbyaceae cyanobacterium SM2_5_2]
MSIVPGESPPADQPSLERIRGIGPARQQQLQELLSITTVQDLALASATEIETAFREAGHLVTEGQAIDWITQARQLMAAEILSEDEGGINDAAGSQNTLSEAISDFGEEESPTLEDESATQPPLLAPPVESSWQTQATVTVELQTCDSGDGETQLRRLLCRESGASMEIPEVEDAPWCTWLREQSGVTLPQPGLPAESPPSQSEPLPVGIVVRQVVLSQPLAGSLPILAAGSAHNLPRALLAYQPFQLSLVFELSGLAELVVPAEASYSLEGFAKA